LSAVRLAAIDLDGTLLRSDGTISPRMRAAARAAVAAGVEIVLVTARGPRTVGGIAAELGIRGEAICSNGAIVLDLDSGRIRRMRTIDREVEAVAAVARELAGDAVSISLSGPWVVEISPAGVNKASALAELCEELGIDAGDVIAFGDHLNDLPMLAWAGRAVAVANAHPDVVELADEVTATNDEDGVALVLERLSP
jgi:hydroxymethylpyrimidine pyrophosphatase-like HAD family hydrolase